ncbi:MAG TPA: metalloregulator ArsR/SmtB family transcription factor [Candidatus Binatia bacterium]|nr:metalloregulator ArsR/SmtB family transcription factor [Candidatus Binatia bacterium]
MVEYKRLNETYGALADPSRRTMLKQLMKNDVRVTDLAKSFDMSLNAVSKHVHVLERAQLVQREIKGREHWLSFNVEPLLEATQWMEESYKFWTRSLARLESHLLKKKGQKKKKAA